MQADAVKKLKKHFQLSNKVGRSSLEKSWSFLKKRPAEAALFTILAANIIKRRNGKATKQV